MKTKLNQSAIKQAIYLIALLVTGMTLPSGLQAQTPYKISSGSQIKVSGTSNLHDWTMIASTFTCEGSFAVSGTQLKDIKALSFVLPVKNLKSKESLMDTRAYKTLKEEQFNKITFKLIDATVNAVQRTVNATGNLTISGVTNK
ncbi:MAG: YceI family protein, partial [Pedobacter sp.]